MSAKIFVCGNPLLDFSANFDKSKVDEYKLPFGSACLAEEHHKALFEEIKAHEDCVVVPGGSAMNTVRGVNFLIKETNPNACLYFGSISKDENGKILETETAKEGLVTNFHYAEDTFTGVCACVICDKERALCADLGACTHYKTSHMEEHLKDAESVDIVYTTGFFVNANAEAVKLAAKWSHEHGKIFAINLSAEFVVAVHKQDYLDLLPFVDIIIGNEAEIKAWGGVHEYGLDEDLKAIAKKIAEFPKENKSKARQVICTVGKLPTITCVHNHESGETAEKEYPVDVIDHELIVDLNGAGDAFVGGFLAGQILGKDFDTSVIAGQYLSSKII